MRGKYGLFAVIAIAAIVAFLADSCDNGSTKKKNKDPSSHTKQLKGGTTYAENGKDFLPDSPYAYELKSEFNSSTAKLTWYGKNQGGGAAYKAEWHNSGHYRGKTGYFWDQGKPYTAYKDISCGFNFKKTGKGNDFAGGYSYIGIHGWSRNPSVEFYIVENSFHDIKYPNNVEYKNEYTMDGALYKVYKGPGETDKPDMDGEKLPFMQIFCIRQKQRTDGTVSVTKHFQKWEQLNLGLGDNMYEAMFMVEVKDGSGSLDFTWLEFSQK
jgi:endo-1,4-beta-xylanase